MLSAAKVIVTKLIISIYIGSNIYVKIIFTVLTLVVGISTFLEVNNHFFYFILVFYLNEQKICFT